MLSLANLPRAALSNVRVVLTDIDDTVTTAGRLEAQAYGALEGLSRAGLFVVPVTGRPAGWCDMIARFWPVAGVVGENGALAFRYDHATRRMERTYAQSAEERAANRLKLDAIRNEVLQCVPAARVSADQDYRLVDLAIDFAEDVGPLSRAEIDAIVACFERVGATAKVSSIHVNGWFGTHDKLSMTKRFLKETVGIDVDTPEGNRACLYVGDSPNDAPIFGHFDLSVGVANIRAFADRCPHLPKFVTSGDSGAGFVEVAQQVLDAR